MEVEATDLNEADRRTCHYISSMKDIEKPEKKIFKCDSCNNKVIEFIHDGKYRYISLEGFPKDITLLCKECSHEEEEVK